MHKPINVKKFRIDNNNNNKKPIDYCIVIVQVLPRKLCQHVGKWIGKKRNAAY